MLNIGLLLKKYSVPTLFMILGLALLMTGLSSEQSLTFIATAFLILITAAISFLNVSGNLSTFMTRIIGLSSFAIALIVLYLTYFSVSDTMSYQKNYEMCKELSRLNLSDLRTAQKAYFERYNSYAQDWETIIDFIETDSVNTVVSEGSVPSRKITEAERNYIYRDNRPIDNNMNELEAYKLSKSKICAEDLKDFKRDTVKVSFIKTTFIENRSYLKERLDNNLGPFDAKSLRYIPFTDNKKEWSIKTAKILIGIDSIATIRVEGLIPFTKIKGQKTKELVYFGKLEMNDLSSSWEEE
jgi:hypothetical protein